MNAALLTIREIAEDMPYLMARASNEGRETGQVLAKETRESLETAIAALSAAPPAPSAPDAIAKAIEALEHAQGEIEPAKGYVIDYGLSKDGAIHIKLEMIEVHLCAALAALKALEAGGGSARQGTPNPAREEAEALVKRLREFADDCRTREPQSRTAATRLTDDAAAFIAREILGEKP